MTTGKVSLREMPLLAVGEGSGPVTVASGVAGTAWRLPSGRPLAEFALSSGFLASYLLVGQRLGPLDGGPETMRGAKPAPAGFIRPRLGAGEASRECR